MSHCLHFYVTKSAELLETPKARNITTALNIKLFLGLQDAVCSRLFSEKPLKVFKDGDEITHRLLIAFGFPGICSTRLKRGFSDFSFLSILQTVSPFHSSYVLLYIGQSDKILVKIKRHFYGQVQLGFCGDKPRFVGMSEFYSVGRKRPEFLSEIIIPTHKQIWS